MACVLHVCRRNPRDDQNAGTKLLAAYLEMVPAWPDTALWPR